MKSILITAASSVFLLLAAVNTSAQAGKEPVNTVISAENALKASIIPIAPKEESKTPVLPLMKSTATPQNSVATAKPVIEEEMPAATKLLPSKSLDFKSPNTLSAEPADKYYTRPASILPKPLAPATAPVSKPVKQPTPGPKQQIVN